MGEFNYDNIDLFYYHSIEFDVSRLDSIVNVGIVSKNKAKSLNLPYYHRNYINSSCKDDYISVSSFSNSLWRYYHIKNELYESATNKITFVISNDIDALEKQSYKKRGMDTPERHVKGIIVKDNIIGIVIRKLDYDKSINEIPFNLKHSDFNGIIKKCFDTINFLKDNHNYSGDTTMLYCMFGKLLESKVMQTDEYDNLILDISNYMSDYLFNAYQSILEISDPRLKDIVKLYAKDLDIYVMSKVDIKKEEDIDKLLESEEEKFHEKYPYKKFQKVSKKDLEEIRKERKLRLAITKLEMQMSESDKKIYLDGYFGPLSENGNDIKEKILKMRNEEVY